MDVYSLNIPKEFAQADLAAKKAKKPVEDPVDRGFVYADFLPAGHHQFILYDITLDSFWMHDFFLDMSKSEHILSIPPKAGPPPPKPWPQCLSFEACRCRCWG